jgi:hypothetical protein
VVGLLRTSRVILAARQPAADWRSKSGKVVGHGHQPDDPCCRQATADWRSSPARWSAMATSRVILAAVKPPQTGDQSRKVIGHCAPAR